MTESEREGGKRGKIRNPKSREIETKERRRTYVHVTKMKIYVSIDLLPSLAQIFFFSSL